MKNNLLILLLLSSVFSHAEVTWFTSQKESSHKLAFVPSYRRSHFLGHILSSRLFVYPTSNQGVYLSLSGHWGLNQKIKGAAGRWIYWAEKSEWSSFLQWEQAFDPFYKDASAKYIRIPIQKKDFRIQYLRTFTGRFQAGLSFEFQERIEEPDAPVF